MSRKLLLAVAVPFVLAACGTAGSSGSSGASSSAPSASANAGATLQVRTVPLGPILVDARGKTLYLFEADTSTASTCAGPCAQAWPPFVTTGTPNVLGPASQALVGTTRRSDGATQVTYKGHPLYYFINDTKPGDTTGEGSTAFGAGWDVVSPAGDRIEQAGN